MPLKKTILAATIAILVLLIPVFCLMLWPEPTDEEAQVTDPPSVQVLFDVNHVEHLEKISFVYQEREKISISRINGGWQITDRPGLPVNGEVMTPILTLYKQILALRTITESCTDLAEYGLDTPALTVTLTLHGTEKTYLFGDRNDYYEGYYCTVKGSTSVYLLDDAYLTAFNLSVDDLLLTPKLPSLSGTTKLQWTSAEGSVTENPQELRGALQSLTIDRMVDWGSEQYAVYGLDKAAVARLTLSDGRELTLRFSEGETEELIYLTIDQQEIIYLVQCNDMATLLHYIRMQ